MARPLTVSFLKRPGTSTRKTLRVLLTSVNWAGFKIQPWASRPGSEDRPFAGEPIDEQPQSLLPHAVTEPLFTVVRQPRLYQLTHADHPRTLVNLRVERIRVDSPKPIRFVTVEFELKHGAQQALDLLHAIANDTPGLIPARMTNFQRGLMASGRLLTADTRLASNHLQPESQLLDLACASLRQQLHQFKSYEPGAWEALHLDGVHQMRVASRRTRVALSLFADILPQAEANRLADDLRWFGRSLGAARDQDVQLLRIDECRKQLKSKWRGELGRYRAHAAREQLTAHDRLRHALAEPRFADLLNNYRALISASLQSNVDSEAPSIAAIAPVLITQHLEKTGKHALDIDDAASEKQLHRLRIAIKRLRYLLEYLLPVEAAAFREPVAALSKLQDQLGSHQDAQLTSARLRKYRNRHAINARERAALRHLIEIENLRKRRARRGLAKHWREFEHIMTPALERVLQDWSRGKPRNTRSG